MYHLNPNQKKARTVIYTISQRDFKAKKITVDKEGPFIRIKRSINQF